MRFLTFRRFGHSVPRTVAAFSESEEQTLQQRGKNVVRDVSSDCVCVAESGMKCVFYQQVSLVGNMKDNWEKWESAGLLS